MLIKNDTGFVCKKKKKFPVKNVCKNVKCGHGSCTVRSTPPFYECKCKPPYRPPDCKRGAFTGLFLIMSFTTISFIHLSFLGTASPCRPDPCQNGGTCVKGRKRSSFQCSCPEGYSGSFCEVGKTFLSVPPPTTQNTHLPLLKFSYHYFLFVSRAKRLLRRGWRVLPRYGERDG